ncbi:DcaP family trimeric outer membrane transporter, partial [Actinokineospora sp.]|uniref:DcaP family trimeric outer membrane transporter n=1 Tax=Actinokineospora sp. TaxID=1872133 RepID=UPI003D6B9811
LAESRVASTDPYALATGGNKRLSQWHLGFYHTPLKNVELGAELIGGKRTTYAGNSGSLSRLNLQARYSFN